MTTFANDATANILVRGLGLASFNRNLNRFENGIIHDGNHQLKIEVAGPSNPMSDITGQVLSDISISFTTTGTPETVGYDRHMGTTFDRVRYANNDMQDIRWLFHLADDLHGGRTLQPTAGGTGGKPAISRLYIENAYFTAEMPSQNHWTKQPFFFSKERPNGMTLPFGFISETAVARMKTDDKVVATVVINGSSKTYEFPHDPNGPYKISISNIDTSGTTTPNEIDILYKYLEDPNNYKYDLKGWREVPEQRKDDDDTPTIPASTGMEYCHISLWGDGGIDDFYQ